MAKKEDLIKFCRYYKGEQTNPFKDGNDSLFWAYEKYWIDQTIKSNGDNNDNFSEFIGDYIRIGLREFEKYDDTPMILKSILFNRFAKGFPSMEMAKNPFEDFYKNDYYK